MKEQIISEKKLRIKNIFAFSFFIVAFSLAFFFWRKLRHEAEDEGIPKTLRKGLSVNESIFTKTFDPGKLVKTYPREEAVSKVRVNGYEGLKDAAFDTASWKLKVLRKNGDTLVLDINAIRQLPKTEVVFDFKCIEGWSQKTWWGGVKFSDFVKAYHLEEDVKTNFAALVTPDKGYYVGIDMPSILHPQTLLCYEMNGKPLPLNQGAPLRLIIPVKYGIKHIKRIGTIYFTDNRPPDFWAERGYDYYAGH
jgi:DMSO/TMAO reductase YedYZ molybdopterin-dependent catalytic subunit